MNELLASADVFINISCATFIVDEYLKIPVRVLIDSDPMFTQIQYAGDDITDAASVTRTKDQIDLHTHFFTFGENVGADDCLVPTHGLNWRPTRQPICLDHWHSSPPVLGAEFTSVMNWSERAQLEFAGEQWGQKDVEFERIAHVPQRLPDVGFAVVVNRRADRKSNFDEQAYTRLGWTILEPANTVAGLDDYRDFIRRSAGEFGVAKETYVKSRSGWFSGRTACYLASGRPAVVQNTGWSKFIPVGNGLFGFTDIDSAVAGIQEIRSNIEAHSKAARELAAAYFASERVLDEMLQQL